MSFEVFERDGDVILRLPEMDGLPVQEVMFTPAEALDAARQLYAVGKGLEQKAKVDGRRGGDSEV